MSQTLQGKSSNKPHASESPQMGGDASRGRDGSLARGVALELESELSAAVGAASPRDAGDQRDRLDMTLEQAVDRAFLSPRVIDQTSFDWLAGSLKKLTTEAASQHRSLSATTTQATTVQAQLQEQLRGLVKDLQGRVDAALKAIPALDARAGRAQALLDRVTNETALSKAREVRDAVIAEVVKQRDVIVTEALQKALEGAKAKFEKDCAEMVRHAIDQARADAILAARAAGHQADTQFNAQAASAAQAQALHSTMLRETDAETEFSISPPVKQTTDGETDYNQQAAHLQSLMTQQQQLTAQMMTIEERVRTLLIEFDAGAARSEDRIAAVQQATERALERAEKGEKGLEQAVLRAQLRLQNASTEAERRTEAVATEIAEQLQALRHDAAETVRNAHASMQASAREQEARLTNTLDGYAARVQAIQTQFEQVHAQHARGAASGTRGESHNHETLTAQPAANVHSAIGAANDAIAKLEAARHATLMVCRSCDEKSHALTHLMDRVEGTMAHIATSAARTELERGMQPVATTEKSNVTSAIDDSHHQAMIISQQLHQLTGQAVQVGQWLTSLLQQVHGSGRQSLR